MDQQQRRRPLAAEQEVQRVRGADGSRVQQVATRRQRRRAGVQFYRHLEGRRRDQSANSLQCLWSSSKLLSTTWGSNPGALTSRSPRDEITPTRLCSDECQNNKTTGRHRVGLLLYMSDWKRVLYQVESHNGRYFDLLHL